MRKLMQILDDARRCPELRARVGFTLLAILAFRIGCHVPTPGVDAAAMARLMSESGGPVFAFFNMFSGGALERFSVLALGIQPYINASIIMQLLVHVVPSLEQLQKDGGPDGRAQLVRWTRYLALALAVVQAFGVVLLLEQWSAQSRGGPLVHAPGWGFRAVAVATLTAGSGLMMWLGEGITKRGVGNGSSVLITAGIVARLPAAALAVGQAFELDRIAPHGHQKLIALGALGVLATAAVVALGDGVRKVPVQHARRVVGRRMLGGVATHIPLRINQGGVLPVIFASSVLMVPALVLSWALNYLDPSARRAGAGWALGRLHDSLQHGHPAYLVCEFGLVIFFSYFYASMQFDPRAVADSLRKYGSFTPGVRAGRATAEYLERILARVTLAGGVFLGAVTLVPHAVVLMFGGVLGDVAIGGTSLLIVVGVVLDTVRQMEALALTRQYERLVTL